jgi:O-antigen ligase
VAIALVVVLAAPPSLHLGLSGEKGSANNATSGRAKLVSGGLKLFADRPLQGFGSGSFAKEYVNRNGVSNAGATSASHTIPITVAAEQGIFGLALYVALVVVALMTLFSKAGRSPPRMALAACFLALVVHTWAYADFLEDPLTWTLLGLGVALLPRPLRAPASPSPDDAAVCATT